MDETDDTQSTGLDKLAVALTRFQAEVPTVAKTKKAMAGSYSYTYADLADVTEVALPLLAKHGLAFVSAPRNGVLMGMLIHTSGQLISGSLPITGGTPQQIGSSLTYMRRYLLSCLTGLVTDNDDDGQIAQAARKQAPEKGPPPPTRTMSRRPQTGGAAASTPPDMGEERAPAPTAAPPSPPGPNMISLAQQKMLHALLTKHGMGDRVAGLAYLSDVLDREVDSSKSLTKSEAGRVLDSLTVMGEAS